MKVLAINGSPRKSGNTYSMLKEVLGVCEDKGIETEIYQAGGKDMKGCKACLKCFEDKGKCIQDDWVNELYLKMKEADAIVIGSPTYFADLTPETKVVIDRCGYVAKGDIDDEGNGAFSGKIGVGISPARRAGAVHTLDSINHFFLISDMVVPGSVYWALSLARNIGEFENDEEGVRTMRRIGDNICRLLKS